MIEEYCKHNKVVISFKDVYQLDALMSLMGFGAMDQSRSPLYSKGGVVSFFKFAADSQTIIKFRLRLIYTKEFDDHTLITAEEFFELANPEVSIMDSII